MKALMSNKLREIIRDPKGNQQLEAGISKLSAECDSNGTEISVGNHKYNIKFVQVDPDKKK